MAGTSIVAKGSGIGPSLFDFVGQQCKQPDTAKAEELIYEALRAATPRAEPYVVGRYEIQAGIITRRAGRKADAMTMHLAAVDRIDPAAQPRLGVLAGHNLAVAAADLGQLDMAMAGLLRLNLQYELAADTKVSLSRERLAGAIAWVQGRLPEAESRFRAAREGFAQQRMFLQAADDDLTIAAVAAERDRSSAAERSVARAARTLFAGGSPHLAARGRSPAHAAALVR